MSDRERYPSEAADRFQVRMTSGLRDRIRQAAEANNRSMNSEIVATLEEKYPAPEPATIEELEAAIRGITELLDRAGPNGQDERIQELARLLVERWFEPPEEAAPKKKRGELDRT
ncbi:Arc family DNA-binding protein [Aureimonas sp. Leaf324]|uniref:Arc family DNA-binding protein n=1 Tax=Aureimonas sp. Leaf324 TaxID=1736336 RepID=UPI00138F454A|nr:Arc family DNA-binding protein [Aureimonas sp. Leaf324]